MELPLTTSIGYPSVYDPGPPSASFVCNSLLTAGPSANPCRNIAAAKTLAPTPAALSSGAVVDSTLLTMAPASTSPSPHLTTAAPNTGGGVTAAANASGTRGSEAGDGGPSAGIKAAIVVCVVLAVLMLAGVLAFCVCLRRQRKKLHGQPYPGHGTSNGGGHVGSGSRSRGGIGFLARLHLGRHAHRHRHAQADEAPSPLISPASSYSRGRGDGVSFVSIWPSTVSGGGEGGIGRAGVRSSHSRQHQAHPPRYRQRRRMFLPGFLDRGRLDRSMSPPLTSLSPPPSPTQLSTRGSGHGSGKLVPYYFPSSPICQPTTNKLEPRRERTPTIRSGKERGGGTIARLLQKPRRQQEGASQDEERQGCPPYLPLVPSLPPSLFPLGGYDGLHAGSPIYGHALTTDTVEPASSLFGGSSRGLGMPPASPVRPPRPHEGPLEIPDLVAPDPPRPAPAHFARKLSGASFVWPRQAWANHSNSYSSYAGSDSNTAPYHGSISLGPPPSRALPRPRPRPPPAKDGHESMASLELPPLLMRNDDEEGGSSLWEAAAVRERPPAVPMHAQGHSDSSTGSIGTAATAATVATVATVTTAVTTTTMTTGTLSPEDSGTKNASTGTAADDTLMPSRALLDRD